jgi:hypothetical protein
MDTVSKILCRMMNGRLFKILDETGTKFQFGGMPGVGCREAIFTLASLLHTRRNHNLDTYVLFVDLVKATTRSTTNFSSSSLRNLVFRRFSLISSRDCIKT